jgi:hypothetical protein
MVNSMSGRQLLEWKAFSDMEPFGLEATLMMFASIVHAIANVNRNPKKHPEPFKMSDFILPLGDMVEALRKGPQTWQEQKALMMAYFPPNESGVTGPKRKRTRKITDPK